MGRITRGLKLRQTKDGELYERKKGKSKKLLERIFPGDDCGTLSVNAVCCHIYAVILACGLYGIYLPVNGDGKYPDYARSCE